MSLTEKTFTRFWSTMGERYGSRWLDSYGAAPTLAWRETLSAFTPKDIKLAIDALATRDDTRQFPPTEPAFKALLVQAARSTSRPVEDPHELRRGFWRSLIVREVSTGLGFDGAEFEAVLVGRREDLGVSMAALLDEFDDLEQRTGQRTSGQESACQQRCREIVVAFRRFARKAA